MKYKKGDSVICKKTLITTHNGNGEELVFKKDEIYKIIDEWEDLCYHIYSPYYGQLSLNVPHLKHVRFGYTFTDWFYSKNEAYDILLNKVK